ncbi:hypothetical protein [Crocosphaera watsonii]|uniref:Uncharacterized protein n=1 Tax=Crocosphaera watsonii WH 8502 TaxID=423474 RepID=T2I9C4_CROWT|nr:hypothetical protein [Crocosphaera watsonii]CCQ49402.1 hypothetical protein CWATWH8502_678 [Crocosphaera watsonii WH 8502]
MWKSPNPEGDQELFGEEFTIGDLIEKGWIDELITKGDSNA